MHIWTLAELEEFLSRYEGKHFIPITRDPVLEQRRSDIKAVRAHWNERAEWAAEAARQERIPLQGQLEAEKAEQDEALGRIRSMYTELAIGTEGDGLGHLEESWPEVLRLNTVEDQTRALMGPDRDDETRAEFRAKGWIVDEDTSESPFRQFARRLRTELDTAHSRARAIQGLGKRIEAVTPYSVDERVTGLENEFFGKGRIVDPNDPNARPQLDERVSQRLGLAEWDGDQARKAV